MTVTELAPAGSPPTLWILQGLLPTLWVCFFVFLLVRSVRAKTATFGLLVLITTSSLFWQDPYINWGMYLRYNPDMGMLPWGPTRWTSPYKPWWTITSYGIFWLAAIPAVLSTAARLRRVLPGLGHVAAVILIGIPAFYLWDLLFEGAAVSGGFYSYVNYWGPALVMRSGNFPLLYPILFIAAWATAAVLLLSPQERGGRPRFESWFHIERLRPGALRELCRAGAWILVLNLFHVLFAILPLVGIRELFGAPSALVP